MFELLKLRQKHGRQAIPEIRKAQLPEIFRGFPLLDAHRCSEDCQACVDICPTMAITTQPLRLDLARCIFCGACSRTCSAGAIQFSSSYRLGADHREILLIHSELTPESYSKAAITARKEIQRLFGRSFKLRQVSAAGCNGCELELNAGGNVNFDMGRFGIDFVASPRHADAIVITGPISANMAPALNDAYYSLAAPRVVIAVGACALGGGVFADSDQLKRDFIDSVPIDLYIPGCPPHPLTFIHALLDFLGR